MGLNLRIATACLLSAVCLSRHGHAQCEQHNYVQDGTPASQRDCQPVAALTAVEPARMLPEDRDVFNAHQQELRQAARFYGFDFDQAGWTWQQELSPLLKKHLLLTYTNATPSNRASRFTAIIPISAGAKVQIIPSFSQGLHPYLPGWQTKGSYSVFNRLLLSEQGNQPLTNRSSWIDYALLYLAVAGRSASIPTDIDSVQATWDLASRRATTPVFDTFQNGSVSIAFSELVGKDRSIDWKLSFNRSGKILKAEKSDRVPRAVHTMQTLDANTGSLTPPSPEH